MYGIARCVGNLLFSYVAIINTYLALCSACVATFVTSVLTNPKRRITMEHIQNATLAGGFLNYQKGASGQKRGPPSSSNSNGGVVFCRAYQTSSCTHAGDHQGDFRGETRLLKHICAKCWLENKTIAAHAEKSGVCPLDG